ncbi:HigA family addiction module antitoxin [Pararhizobium antarcticum]|uniref:Addiction module antitoxin n=1 Tax=Pararhizobium antarcticum TaxID=1798805 RepID=A0A657LQU5_9HYPH|nr:HigA family addiction module antitoxin [Pararhizobium antarcticum]OJF94009.1 addiction module antitoxin [Pararhizobium antarcticum]OJF97497.1 addiction module antitoxin [Rhizobium sp. 58]
MPDLLPPIHPGEILKELYLDPLEMSAGMLAKKLNVPRTRIERIVSGKTAITSDTALRLARFFNTTPQLWMNLQVSFDLKIEAERNRAEIERIPVRDAA